MIYRTSADNNELYSTRGLDERQIAIKNEIALSCFGLMFLLVTFASLIFIVLCNLEIEIFNGIIALVYLAIAILSHCVFSIAASGEGVINNITTWSYSKGELVKALVYFIWGIGFIMAEIFVKDYSVKYAWLLSAFLFMNSIKSVIFYFCGKHNLKVLIEQMKEDEEDE